MILPWFSNTWTLTSQFFIPIGKLKTNKEKKRRIRAQIYWELTLSPVFDWSSNLAAGAVGRHVIIQEQLKTGLSAFEITT